METQNLLHQRSDEMPEGLYIDLMNKLKIDFDQNKAENKTQIIVIHRSIAKNIACTKIELQQKIITASINWLDREEILLNLPTRGRGTCYSGLKELCQRRGLSTMKINPRWVANEAIIQETIIQRNDLRRAANSPGIFHI